MTEQGSERERLPLELDRLGRDDLGNVANEMLARIEELNVLLRAASTYVEVVESGAAKEDGGVSLHVTYRVLRDSVRALTPSEAEKSDA